MVERTHRIHFRTLMRAKGRLAPKVDVLLPVTGRSEGASETPGVLSCEISRKVCANGPI
jgi:hypothetical protein